MNEPPATPPAPAWHPGDTLRCTTDAPPGLDQPCRLLTLDDGIATVEANGHTWHLPAAHLRLSIPARPAPGRYRHHRGGLYTLLCVARHSETEEWLVAYSSEQTGDHWVRPLSMWSELVDGRPRFEQESMGSPSAGHSNAPGGPSEPSASYAQTRKGSEDPLA